MRDRAARLVSGLITRRPGLLGLLLLALTLLALWRASLLRINHNQLDLLPEDLASVRATKAIIPLIGDVGFLILALKANPGEHLQTVAEDLAPLLGALPEVRAVIYRQDVDFVRERIALYVAPADLEEAYRRVRKAIRQAIRKANPFHIQLSDEPDAPLVLDDLIEKYQRLNKKGIDDPYYFDPKKEMLLVLLKPKGSATDLEFCAQLVRAVERTLKTYSETNPHGARLVEHYGGLAPGATVSYGYTGAYKRNLDDSETIRRALAPTSVVAFVGILLYLLLFMRRPSQIILIKLPLLASVVMTFAFCELTIGELNTVTALLGAILMGVGIDYGIFFMYRFREEYARSRSLETAIGETVKHAGAASLTSALTTAAALYTLSLGQFKGFSHFGWVIGTGVLITAVMMYLTIPVAYLLIDRVWPRFKESLATSPESRWFRERDGAYPYARRILLLTLGLTAVLGAFAFGIRFDYDGRALMTADRPSVVLQEEINRRYQISSDPVGVYTPTLALTQALYDTLIPLKADTTIDSVVSILSVVPPRAQQEKNVGVLARLKQDLEPLTPEMLDEKQRDLLARARLYLDAQPFTLADVPEPIARQFRPVPESGREGYLTFIYPKVSIWDGREIMRFAAEVGALRVGGEVFHTAGMAVIYADLAAIVLRDGVRLSLLAAVVILAIMIVRFRGVRAALFGVLPLAAGMVWMLGLMALTGWRINFMNIVVLPVVFGYGISTGVYLYYRFLESGSVRLAVQRTGVAVTASSIATLIGWAALLVSNHRGLASMGILACFGIASALVVSLTVLPALLQVWQSRRAAAHPSGPEASR